MLSVTAIETIRKIKDELLGCLGEKDDEKKVQKVEAVFSQSEIGINDFPLKTMLLRYTMQVQEVFAVPSDNPSDTLPANEADYEEELRFFFDEKWKELV